MKTSKKLLIAAAILLTLVAVVIGLNLTGSEEKIERELARLYSTQDEQFLRDMGVLLGPPIVDGNRFQVLLNGDQIFPAMLGAIRGARRTITFETYIYWSGQVGRQFADALAERARSGVKVHVLLDWVGSNKADEKLLDRMRQAGVEVVRFHKPRWYNLTRMNNRTHRKILVIDGHTAFTGGVGIADKWSGNAQDENHWRDTHFVARGPVTAQFQTVFIDNWVKATGKVLHGEAYFPRLEKTGASAGQMFSSSPHGGAESMHLMYLLSITSARSVIRLSCSYFVPDELTQRALIDAARRGVKIQLIVPGPVIDTQTVRKASHATWGKLLQAGIEIYEFQPTMYHVKVMIVDDFMVSVGSTNFDNRSFRLNDEANLNIYDAAFARQQKAIFEDDLKRSKRVTLEQWKRRPWSDRVLEWAASTLSSQL